MWRKLLAFVGWQKTCTEEQTTELVCGEVGNIVVTAQGPDPQYSCVLPPGHNNAWHKDKFGNQWPAGPVPVQDFGQEHYMSMQNGEKYRCACVRGEDHPWYQFDVISGTEPL